MKKHLLEKSLALAMLTWGTVALGQVTLLNNEIPEQVRLQDGKNYELGLRFMVSSPGEVKAIRFYKSPGESSRHTGKIYSANGTLLTQVQFSGESRSGWQQQDLSQPLAVEAGVEYVVSVNTSRQYYVVTEEVFYRSIGNGFITALREGGVYGPIGKVPSRSYRGSNYFRDIVFVGSVDSDSQADSTATEASEGGQQSSVVELGQEITEPVAPTPVVTEVDPPLSATSTGLPLSWDDSIFQNVINSTPVYLKDGGSLGQRSIVDQSGDSTITCLGSCQLSHIRMYTREGVRCVKGNISLDSMWIETKGQAEDHADGLQCYSPGSTGTVTVKNTTFRSYSGPTHTGYFSADDWRGQHIFENVLFWGGNFGLRVPADGGSSLSLKDVYFVKNSFMYSAILLDEVNGKRIPIERWENVRWVSIENGQMILGDLIPRPY